MRRFWSIAAAALLGAALVADASCQTLNLGRPAPPRLDTFTYAKDLAGVLEREVAQRVAAEADAGEMARIALRAGTNLRILAADLLTLGDAAGHEGSVAIVTGLTLAQGREQVDESLSAVLAAARDATAANAPQARRAIESLRTFNEDIRSLRELLRTPSASSIDEHLPILLAPLATALSAFHGQEGANHWVSSSLIRPAANMAGGASASARGVNTIDELRGRAVAAALREETRGIVVTVLDILEQGQEFAEFRPRVEAYRALLTRLFDLCDALSHAAWMEETSRQAYDARIHEALALFQDRAARDRGEALLRRFESSRLIIERITLLSQINRDRPNIRPLAAALIAGEQLLDNPALADTGREQMAKLRLVLDRMIAWRELRRGEVRGEHRTLATRLEREYRDAEASLLKEIERITADPRAISDPAFTSVMANQAQYLEDVIRLEKIPRWIDQIRSLRPGAVERFTAQTRKMAQWLLEPARRDEAILAMTQYEQQAGLFLSMPFESNLRAGGEDAALVTGGLHDRLAREIDAQRQRWADGWALGNAGSDAAKRLLLLFRLTQAMADSAEVARLGGDAGPLNAWAAWEAAPRAIAPAVHDVPNRLRLATRAALEGNERELASQLSRIDQDAAMAKIVGRLAMVVGPALQGLPGGSVGIIGQCAARPREDAFLLSRRVELAHLCRYALEEHFARTNNRESVARECSAYLNGLAAELLDSLGERTTPIPTLLGFDGTDPEGKG